MLLKRILIQNCLKTTINLEGKLGLLLKCKFKLEQPIKISALKKNTPIKTSDFPPQECYLLTSDIGIQL
jgi:hypothetical protein